jgi:hypothetical protein
MPYTIDHPNAPGWLFTLSEISNGAWRVEGCNAVGQSVSRTGHDEAALILECVNDAREKMAQKQGR